MKSRRTIVVIDGFYRDSQAVRNYALRQRYYLPYQDQEAIDSGRELPNWWASYFRRFDECPFKSSKWLIDALENAVDESIDMDHWRAPFAVDAGSKPLPVVPNGRQGCLWNCCFHVKPDNGQQLGDGIHNHVSDGWNSVGANGWAGLIYLSPAAPLSGGLHLWRNLEPLRNFDWMTPAENWQLIDSFGNLFNRLILVRGDVPHSGAGGWGNSLECGRMYQTFFFRTKPKQVLWPVSMPEIGG
jgi:hypothetical protein